MDLALLDKDIFSEILKGKNARVMQNATTYRNQFGHYIISAITLTEVIKASRNEPARIESKN